MVALTRVHFDFVGNTNPINNDPSQFMTGTSTYLQVALYGSGFNVGDTYRASVLGENYSWGVLDSTSSDSFDDGNGNTLLNILVKPEPVQGGSSACGLDLLTITITNDTSDQKPGTNTVEVIIVVHFIDGDSPV